MIDSWVLLVIGQKVPVGMMSRWQLPYAGMFWTHFFLKMWRHIVHLSYRVYGRTLAWMANNQGPSCAVTRVMTVFKSLWFVLVGEKKVHRLNADGCCIRTEYTEKGYTAWHVWVSSFDHFLCRRAAFTQLTINLNSSACWKLKHLCTA